MSRKCRPCAYSSGGIGISHYSRLNLRSTSAKVTKEDLSKSNGGQIDSVIMIPQRERNFPSCEINWDLISSR